MSEDNIKRWLKTSLEERKLEIEIDYFNLTKASALQKHMISFYKQLDTVIEPDHYREWLSNLHGHYRQFWRLESCFVELGDVLGVLEPSTVYEGYDGVQEILFAISTRLLKDRMNTKSNIRNWINMKWGIIDVKKKYIPIQVTDEVNDDILEKIRLARRTEIEKIAEKLNLIVFVGGEIWECILYGVLSVEAPDIIINGIPQRGNLHTNMIGEISSGKTSIMRVLKRISPRWLAVTKTTEASFEGISKAKEIEQGIIEKANDGILLIPEFKRTISKFKLLREAMDCDVLTITKRGITKTIKVNTSFIVASNPKEDFFREGTVMRKDIPFEEGILSRFDFLIPFIVGVKKNAEIAEKMQLFGGDVQVDELTAIQEILRILCEGMRMVKEIRLTEKQKNMLKEIWLKYNIKMGNRPLVILRDLETLARLVNVIVASNFFNRSEIESGIFEAVDVDIYKAITIWENLIYLRKQLYEMQNDKVIKTTSEKIIELIAENDGEITTKALKELILSKKVCSQATFYRKVKRLEAAGLIEVMGKDSEKAMIKLVVEND